LGFDPLGPLPKFDEFLQRVHPEDRNFIKQRFETAVRERKDFEADYRIVHPSSGIRDIHVIAHAILGSNAGLVEFVGTVIDVTERKRAEEELQQLVDFVPQIIVVLTPDGKWIHANRVTREYTGLSIDQSQNIDVISAAVHPEDADRMRSARQQGLAGQSPFDVEARLLGKDSIYRWFLFRYSPLIKHQRVIRWYGTATEIQSRKEEEERMRREMVRLEERTRIAQEFHDTFLQTFLSASMQLGVALNNVAEDSPEKALLDRVLGLMGQGIEQGRNALQGLRASDSRPVDLIEALSGIRREFLSQSDVEFHAVSTGAPRLLQPPVQHEIYRIGREALINAFRHSQAKRIDLVFEYTDDALRMRVRDNGCGIDCKTVETGRDGHWGLAGMRERAEKIGGQLKILKVATSGTEILLSIPGRNAFQDTAA
jgi:PAS domain S-box-containing protein